MPRKSRATRSRLQNLSKIKKQNNKSNNNGKSTYSHFRSQTPESLLPQTKVLDEQHEPNTLDTDNVVPNEDDDDFEGSSVEILDGCSDTDIREESELTRFSRMLCEAQEKALAEEKVKGNKQKSYTGHSQATAYRQKQIQTDNAAQGYFPVHEFMRRIQLQKSEKKVTPSFKEESSDDDVITCIDELKASEGMDVKLTPAVREDRHQAAHSPAASEGNHQFVQDPVEHCRVWALQEEELEVRVKMKELHMRTGKMLQAEMVRTCCTFSMPGLMEFACRIVLHRGPKKYGHSTHIFRGSSALGFDGICEIAPSTPS